MNFGKKLAIIGLIVFGVGVPSTTTTMSSSLFDLPHGMQQSSTIDGIVVYPNESKNIKHTLRGYNPILVTFEVEPQKIPYNIIVTNYQLSQEVLNVVESGSAQHRIEIARPATHDFDFVNMGTEELYITIEIKDTKHDQVRDRQELIGPLMIYIYYSVFIGGIVVGSIGIAIWRMTK